MAYTAPTVRSVGDAVTAADYNIMANNDIQIATMARGVFTNEAARDAAITSPTEGMHVYLTAPTVPAATGEFTLIPTGVQTIYNGSVWVCLTEVAAFTTTFGNTTSTSLTTTLSSGGTNPSVTCVTGTTALVTLSAQAFSDSTAAQTATICVSVSGATTIAAAQANGLRFQPASQAATYDNPTNITFVLRSLTAGTNTFTLNYAVGTSNGTWFNRRLSVRGIA